MALDYLPALHRFQDDFLASIGEVGPDAPVRSCGDWTVADLVVHLAGIHQWAAAKASGLRGNRQRSPRPSGTQDLVARYERSARNLRETFARLDPDARAWTLLDQGVPPKQRAGTVRFWHRRQALETLVHAWDLRTAAGLDYEPGVESWLDCLDEVVAIMHPRQMRLGRITPPVARVRLAPTDTEQVWELSGADPAAPVVTVTGEPRQLALLLWGRADPSALQVAGDRAGLDAVLAQALTP